MTADEWLTQATTAAPDGVRIALPARHALPTGGPALFGAALIAAVLADSSGLVFVGWAVALAGTVLFRARPHHLAVRPGVVTYRGLWGTRTETEIDDIAVDGDCVIVDGATGVVEIRLTGAPPGSAEALATFLRRTAEGDAPSVSEGLDRWTRWSMEGATIDLSPVHAPAPVVLLLVGACGIAALTGLVAAFCLGAVLELLGGGPDTSSLWISFTASVLGFVGSLGWWVTRPVRTVITLDRDTLGVTRTSRVRIRRRTVPLGDVAGVHATGHGLLLETRDGPVHIGLPGRSGATREALAQKVADGIARARDPGRREDVPNALRALSATRE